jgi:hypothetical protein
MLAWSDYPGSPDVRFSLVNDLNLVVTAPDGSALPGNGATDKTNNVEAVNFDAAPQGAYRITVTGRNVPQGPQPFAADVLGAIGDLVVPGDLDGNGRVTIQDVLMALQAAVGLHGLSEDAELAGDVITTGNSAGKVDLLDVTALLRAAVGLQAL